MSMLHSTAGDVNKGHAPKVLILDDEAMVVSSLQSLIELETDYQVLAWTRPEDALESLAQSPVDVIITDFLMSEMNGLEFLIQARRKARYASLIMLTGYADKENAIRAVNEVGVYHFIEKPWNNERLLMVLRNAVERGELLTELGRQCREIRKAYIETIYRLSITAEIFDDDTYTHVLRIARLSSRLAELSGEAGDYSFNVHYASMMHDVGKIGVPKTILNKPGRLTEEEFEVVKQHPLIGAHILSHPRSDLMKMAFDIAKMHHEKASGKGYPQGIGMADIPKSARIVAVADAFDAMMSKRVYKEPFPPEKVFRIFAEDHGCHFDPQLTALLLEHFEEFVDIHTRTVVKETEELSHILFENNSSPFTWEMVDGAAPPPGQRHRDQDSETGC